MSLYDFMMSPAPWWAVAILFVAMAGDYLSRKK